MKVTSCSHSAKDPGKRNANQPKNSLRKFPEGLSPGIQTALLSLQLRSPCAISLPPMFAFQTNQIYSLREMWKFKINHCVCLYSYRAIEPSLVLVGGMRRTKQTLQTGPTTKQKLWRGWFLHDRHCDFKSFQRNMFSVLTDASDVFNRTKASYPK